MPPPVSLVVSSPPVVPLGVVPVERLSAPAAASFALAQMATLANLPGCESADWLPCPEHPDLPEVGRC